MSVDDAKDTALRQRITLHLPCIGTARLEGADCRTMYPQREPWPDTDQWCVACCAKWLIAFDAEMIEALARA